MADTAPSPLQALTGRVQLRPAAGLPAVHNSRPALAERLAPGRTADELPRLLASLFTLCAHAHRSCAEQAIAAARGVVTPASPASAQALQLGTLRDQVLRISHDWPRQLHLRDNTTHSAVLLRSCPLWRDDLSPDERLAELPAWLAHHWLGESIDHWLARHEADPTGAAAAWAIAHRGTSAVALLLRRLLAEPISPMERPIPGHSLNILQQPGELPALAHQMAHTPGFCSQPDWHNTPASTGPWSRVNDPLPAPDTATTAWHLLVARIVDVLRLSGPQGATWLSHGALPLPDHEGLAWCEMARGLLLHWVKLTPDGQRIEAYRVLAPTEWNFHAEGPLALALARLEVDRPRDELLAASRCLAVAFDPCVDFEVHLPDTAPMSPPGRPKGKYRRAKPEGTLQ